MKKGFVLVLIALFVMGTMYGCSSTQAEEKTAEEKTEVTRTLAPTEKVSETDDAGDSEKPEPGESGGNFTDEMKIEQKSDISVIDGADSVEREGDHQGSLYFSNLDFYNMESNDTLTMLSNYKTIQQSSEWSCGVAAIMTVLEHYDMLGDYTEQTLSELRPQGDEPGATSLPDAIEIFNKVGGFELITTRDFKDDEVYDYFTLDKVQELLSEDTPVLICWNDWGGHWQAIIGYDTMGTETQQDDVIIVADPYDTTDHNQDGYGVYGAERFFYNFTMYDFFTEEEGNDMLFIAAKPAA